MIPQHYHRWILLVSCAVGIRLIALLVFPGLGYYGGISRPYVDVATSILQGNGIVLHVDVAPLSEPSLWKDEPFIDRPLGYVMLILAPLALAGHPIAIQIFQILLSAVTVVLIVYVGETLGGKQSAWLAAFLYALWPLSARFEVTILPDAVMPLFVVGSLALFLTALRKSTMFLFLITGVSIGVGVTMRPDIVFLPLVFLLFLFLNRSPRRFLAGGILILGTLSILTVHTIRNYEATDGHIVPLGLGNGISMWEGISQFGDTLGTVYGDDRMTALEGYRSWAYPNGVDRDRRRFQDALRIITDHPWWYATVMMRRLPVLLTPDGIMNRAFAPSYKEYRGSSEEHSLLSYVLEYPVTVSIRIILILLQYCSLALATFAFIRKRHERILWLPALVILYYIVIHIPTNAEARYFYPAIPVVLLLAAQGWEILRNKQLAHGR